MAAKLKTKETTASVTAFLANLEDPSRREDCRTLVGLMKKATGAPPKMWGPSIVGFGKQQYSYASGRVGDWPLAAFSPRKRDLTLYIGGGFPRYGHLLKKLGKFKTGKVCLYLKSLSDVDLDVLDQLIVESVVHMRKNPTLA
ncbi:MAG: DUF1801 domain-containing protein [Candidatus Eiseniibacteriota bacterium]